METTRVLYAQELVAEGEARGKAIGKAEGEARGKTIGKAEGKAEGEAMAVQIIKLYLQKKTPKEISRSLRVPASKVNEILAASGLLEQPL